MRMFYLVSAIVLGVFILILSFAQVGATCSWFLISSQSAPFLVLLQVALLGAVMGGLFVLWWKQPAKDSESGEGDDADA